MKSLEGFVSEDSFTSILVMDGEGMFIGDTPEESVSYQKGDSLFLPAGSGEYKIEGTCDALVTTIRAKAEEDYYGKFEKIGM